MKCTTPVLSLLAAVLLFSACSDDNVIDALPSRYVYYIDAGGTVQRHDLTLDKNETPGITDVQYITSVADNGIVLFEKGPEAETVLWGFCEDGSIVPVPMPVSVNAGEEYVYGKAHASLSRQGHHAAWSVYRRGNGSADTIEWTQELIRFDCNAWKMSQADLSTFLREEMQGSGFEANIIAVEQVMISRDGSRTLCSVRVTDVESSGSRRSQFLLIRWDSAGLTIVLGKSRPIELLTFDFTCDNVYFLSGGDFYSIPCGGGSAVPQPMEGNKLYLLTQQCFAVETGEYVSSFINGDILALSRFADDTHTSVVKTIRDITAHFPEVTFGALGDWAAVSPDGQWVIFPWKTTDAEIHIFAIRRDGSKFRRLAMGYFPLQAVVSNEIPL